jgi:hypothetical protein
MKIEIFENNFMNWNIIYKWEDIDHIKFERWFIWYFLFSGFILFCVIAWIFQGSYTMPIVFIMIWLFYLIAWKRILKNRKNALTTLWLLLWEKFYPYSKIELFYFSYYENIHILNIKESWKMSVPIEIPVINWDSAKIRNILIQQNIFENEEKKDWFTKRVCRKLKL